MEQYPSFDGSQICAQTDPELWFPTSEKQTGRLAKSLCRKCPWVIACMEYALRHEVLGIWGATTERERVQARKSMGIKAEPLYLDNILGPSLRGKVRFNGYNETLSEVADE